MVGVAVGDGGGGGGATGGPLLSTIAISRPVATELPALGLCWETLPLGTVADG